MGCGMDVHRLRRGLHGDSSAEAAVLVLELLDTALEVGELGLPAVSAVLGSDAVAVRPGLFALVRAELGAGTLARWLGWNLGAEEDVHEV